MGVRPNCPTTTLQGSSFDSFCNWLLHTFPKVNLNTFLALPNLKDDGNLERTVFGKLFRKKKRIIFVEILVPGDLQPWKYVSSRKWRILRTSFQISLVFFYFYNCVSVFSFTFSLYFKLIILSVCLFIFLSSSFVFS